MPPLDRDKLLDIMRAHPDPSEAADAVMAALGAAAPKVTYAVVAKGYASDRGAYGKVVSEVEHEDISAPDLDALHELVAAFKARVESVPDWYGHQRARFSSVATVMGRTPLDMAKVEAAPSWQAHLETRSYAERLRALLDSPEKERDDGAVAARDVADTVLDYLDGPGRHHDDLRGSMATHGEGVWSCAPEVIRVHREVHRAPAHVIATMLGVAAGAFPEDGDAKALVGLLAAYVSGDPALASAAADALGVLGRIHPEAVSALSELSDTLDDADARAAVSGVLQGLYCPPVAP